MSVQRNFLPRLSSVGIILLLASCRPSGGDIVTCSPEVIFQTLAETLPAETRMPVESYWRLDAYDCTAEDHWRARLWQMHGDHELLDAEIVLVARPNSPSLIIGEPVSYTSVRGDAPVIDGHEAERLALEIKAETKVQDSRLGYLSMNGRLVLVYRVEILAGLRRYQVVVDALSGTILRVTDTSRSGRNPIGG